MKYAKARTEEEKKEIYDKWEKLINMSEKELLAWAENDDRFLASLNRAKAEEEGDIQSGYDSFHRIKRRKIKPMKEWSAQDFDNASQENGFNSRMLGGEPGQPVKDTNMSKWEISLRNWGHDPSKKSSPSYDKWKEWDKKHNKSASIAHLRKIERIREISKILLKNKNKNKKVIIFILTNFFENNSQMFREEWSSYFNGLFGRTLTSKEIAENFFVDSNLNDQIRGYLANGLYQDESCYLTLSHKYFSAREASNSFFIKKAFAFKNGDRKMSNILWYDIHIQDPRTLKMEVHAEELDLEDAEDEVKKINRRGGRAVVVPVEAPSYGRRNANISKSSSRILWYNIEVRNPYSGDVELYAEELSKREAEAEVRNIKSHGGDAWIVPVTSQDQFNKANSFLGYRNANLKGKSDMRHMRTASSVLRDLEIRVARLERTSARGNSYVLTDAEVRAVEMNQRGYGFAKIILDNLDYDTNTVTLDNMAQNELVEEIYGDGIGTLDNRSQLAKWMFSLEPV